MASFLFTLWPLPGHLNPNLAVADALRQRGHEVAFYTGGAAPPILEREGFRCFPFQKVPWARVSHLVYTIAGLPSWRRLFQEKPLWRQWLVETVPAQIDDLKAVLAEWRVDVLVCDPAMWGPFLVLGELERIPVSILSYVAGCLLPGADGPLMAISLPKARSWHQRLVVRVARSLLAAAGSDIPRAASQLRQSYGLPPLQTAVTEFTGQMPLYLMPSTPEFDYDRKDLPPSVRYVGPCLWDKPSGEAPPAWLAGLPRDSPVVYVTEGTVHSAPPVVLRAALEGLADLPMRLIVTTGRHRDPRDPQLGPIPRNARVEQWVPHSDLLSHVDVVVTTGGSGTVLGALQAGIPLVVIPFSWDQPENAWRLSASGAGLRISRGRCTPGSLRAAVQRVLAEPSFRENAGRLAAAFASRGGPQEAAKLLEGLAA